jgi:hypothetical protein
MEVEFSRHDAENQPLPRGCWSLDDGRWEIFHYRYANVTIGGESHPYRRAWRISAFHPDDEDWLAAVGIHWEQTRFRSRHEAAQALSLALQD